MTKQHELYVQKLQHEGVSIPRTQLATKTRNNLDRLEVVGFVFEDTALKIPVTGRKAYSYTIAGTDPTGAPALYVRKETASPTAGQTILYDFEGRPTRVSVALTYLEHEQC